MLYQLSYFRLKKNLLATLHSQIFWWEVVDSNHRTLRERIYSPPQLPLCEPPSVVSFRADRGIRTHDPEITNHVLWPTELYRRGVLNPSLLKGIAKVEFFSESAKLFALFSFENTNFLQNDAGVQEIHLHFVRSGREGGHIDLPAGVSPEHIPAPLGGRVGG